MLTPALDISVFSTYLYFSHRIFKAYCRLQHPRHFEYNSQVKLTNVIPESTCCLNGKKKTTMLIFLAAKMLVPTKQNSNYLTKPQSLKHWIKLYDQMSPTDLDLL